MIDITKDICDIRDIYQRESGRERLLREEFEGTDEGSGAQGRRERESRDMGSVGISR